MSEHVHQGYSTYNHNHIGYDVFISFRGADTRNNFTDHLYNALLDAKIDTFLDEDEIETGEDLKPKLENAIKSSRVSIIVLSKNYAASTWCLDELALILEQRLNSDHSVIPIFYHVEPTHVRMQQNSFGDAIASHKQRMEAETNAEKRSQWTKKMDRWIKALTEVADLKGKGVKDRRETEFIREIVADIHERVVSFRAFSQIRFDMLHGLPQTTRPQPSRCPQPYAHQRRLIFTANLCPCLLEQLQKSLFLDDSLGSSLPPQAAMEKNRRDQMKELYTKLASLLRLQSYERMPLLTLLEQATISIQQWKERVERLMARKEELVNEHRGASSSEHNLQMVQVSEMDSNLEVNLIVNVSNKKAELSRVLSIIQECGAEIVSCNISCMGQHYMRYTIHAQAFQTRLGFDSSLIEYRLKHIVT